MGRRNYYRSDTAFHWDENELFPLGAGPLEPEYQVRHACNDMNCDACWNAAQRRRDFDKSQQLMNDNGF